MIAIVPPQHEVMKTVGVVTISSKLLNPRKFSSGLMLSVLPFTMISINLILNITSCFQLYPSVHSPSQFVTRIR